MALRRLVWAAQPMWHQAKVHIETLAQLTNCSSLLEAVAHLWVRFGEQAVTPWVTAQCFELGTMPMLRSTPMRTKLDSKWAAEAMVHQETPAGCPYRRHRIRRQDEMQVDSVQSKLIIYEID